MYRRTEELKPKELYNIFTGSVVPRPIAWVSTVNALGQPNLAPFSFFMVASANPPVVCFAPALKSMQENGEKKIVPKDTLRNILDTREFVVNIVSLPTAEQMNQTSGNYSPATSEFEEAHVTALPSQAVAPPRVAESMVSFECRLRDVISFGQHEGAGNLVLGDVVGFHLDDNVWQNGHIDIATLQPIGRLAGNDYCKITDIFQLKRP
jgi:flavin reductase (DIM6/NTAB) family NADH-FMN oxidoreductase RutF